MSELKSCPHCGASASAMRERYINGTVNRKHYRRECRVCHATFANWYRRVAQADAAWNRRTQPENKEGVNKALCSEYVTI